VALARKAALVAYRFLKGSDTCPFIDRCATQTPAARASSDAPNGGYRHDPATIRKRHPTRMAAPGISAVKWPALQTALLEATHEAERLSHAADPVFVACRWIWAGRC